MIHLSALFVYPVKSLGGFSVPAADMDALGLVGDRRFMVVDENGRFLTQRALPRMALIRTALTADQLELSLPGAGRLQVPRTPDPQAPLRNVSVWSSEGLLAEDCGNEPAGWLSHALGLKCQ